VRIPLGKLIINSTGTLESKVQSVRTAKIEITLKISFKESLLVISTKSSSVFNNVTQRLVF